MSVETEVCAEGGRLVVVFSGHLELLNVSEVRTQLLKCLAEQPDALLLDISALDVREPLALAVFAAVARQAERWPGIPVLLCGPRSGTRQSLHLAAYKQLLVFASLDAARAVLDDDRRVRPSLSDELLPVRGAARQARNIATEACLRWDLPHLVAPASLIASELVSNVVDHAHTMMTLRVTLRRRYLQIAVRDGSSEPPMLPTRPSPTAPGGRGLILVNASAHAWDWLPCAGGKVVWASLATS
ncbi:ATP-binding protein [Couchioplanes caeruleus]|uniref:ATPase n=2 Tax=Couchioplanes caeruleus TaxID=56438 RepID=A0A1K0GM67_9ACTN|nr:ATP-binding protein [Couchioplanes caeruleus]OJF10291.1 ATPase [Couchioplanes caeruleus subsp. caeruleus]ROP34226.1 histidine kinase-like protein [Couchioplanes caeruleus]